MPLSKRFVFGATFERGEVSPAGTPLAGTQPLTRVAGTAYASYAGEVFRAQIKGELRQDSLVQPSGVGTTDESQWLVQGMVTWRVHPDFTLRGKILLELDGALVELLDRALERSHRRLRLAPVVDRSAWCCSAATPISTKALPNAQAHDGPDRSAHRRAARLPRARARDLARRRRPRILEVLARRKGRGQAARRAHARRALSAWMILWINRVTLHVTRAWDGLVEYRLLYGPGPALSHGVAIEVNRIIVGHLRLGVGWNFANFTDDETRLGDGTEKGFFVRAQGFY